MPVSDPKNNPRNLAVLAPSLQVRMSSRLFSQEVAIADADAGVNRPPTDWGYVFNNGRKFYDKKDPYGG